MEYRQLSTQQTGYINNKDFIESDMKLNQTLTDVLFSGLQGASIGLLSCVFFKNKARVIYSFTGFGIGYAATQNLKQLCNCNK